MKRILTLILCAALCASLLCVPVSASGVTGAEAVHTLETLGLVRGSAAGFEPERNATRAEAAVMLLRLMGKEQAALASDAPCPFADAGWAEPYLAYAYQHGLVRGVSDTTYGCDGSVSARDYVTMILRVLGYQDEADFTWGGSLAFADRLGLTGGEYSSDPERPFLREDMALLSYSALRSCPKRSSNTLLYSLCEEGVVSADAVRGTRLAAALNGGETYSAVQIYELCADAVFATEAFDSETEQNDDHSVGTGTGFFISSDGVAVMCYHQLEGAASARISTTDGRVYPLERVISYDPQRDLAVVRVGRVDAEGAQVRFFPTVTLGNSDAVLTGEHIYTIANPLGLNGTIADGLVSYQNRIVNDPDYPYIQVSAPATGGSSGGPVFNERGEVIGLISSGFTAGENLNLAVPSNAVRSVDLSAEGIPLTEVLAIEDGKKAQAVIRVSEEYVTLRVGESRVILASTDCPGEPGLRYDASDEDVVRCEWKEYVTMQSVNIKLTGRKAGTSDVKITFAPDYGNTEASAVIHVTVTD